MAVKSIDVHYSGQSKSQIVREQGGMFGGTVHVGSNQGIADEVLIDINANIAENPGDNSYKLLQQWAKEDKDRTDYQYKTDTNSKDYKEGRNSVTATDKDGNTLNIYDITNAEGTSAEDNVNNVAGGAAGIAMGVGGSVLGVITMVETNKLSVESAEKISEVPFGGPVVGAIMLACAIASLVIANTFDKDLTKREAFRDAVSSYIQNADEQVATITDLAEQIKEERTTRFEEAAAEMAAKSKDWVDELNDLYSQVELARQNMDPNALEELSGQIKELVGSEPLSDDLDIMGEIRDEGYDDLYSQMQFADGMKSSYEIVKQFLGVGKTAGDVALTASLGFGLCTLMMAVSIVQMALTITKGDPFTAIARAIAANIGIALTAGATVSLGIATKKMWDNKSREYSCNDKVQILQAQAIKKLDDVVKQYSTFDQELMGEMDAMYGEAEGVIQDTYKTVGETHKPYTSTDDGDNGNNGGDGGNGGADGAGGTT